MNPFDSSLLNYLVSDFTVSFKDPVWSDMLFTRPLAAIIHHPQMQKLSSIRQLGPTSILYPGAVHTRLSHCMGVCHISRLMLISLLRSSQVNLTKEGVNSFLCAALLHDIGHFPYAHSLKDIITRTHESLACDIILNDESLSALIREAGADAKTVCSIISPEDVKARDDETVFYQNMLSGALDPDKLDYLCRDAYFCGVPYGVQDVSFITQHLLAANNRVALAESNSSCIEHLLFSKYLMYRNVYWHWVTRSATAMVKQALKGALEEGVLRQEQLFFLDDYQFFELCEKTDYRMFDLVREVRKGSFYYSNWEISCPGPVAESQRLEVLEMARKKLGGLCEKHQIICDVPEPISFESDILLIDSDGNGSSFRNSNELFAHTDVAQRFTESLRKMRIFSPVKEKIDV